MNGKECINTLRCLLSLLLSPFRLPFPCACNTHCHVVQYFLSVPFSANDVLIDKALLTGAALPAE